MCQESCSEGEAGGDWIHRQLSELRLFGLTQSPSPPDTAVKVSQHSRLLPHDYITDIPSHLSRLVQLYEEGRLRVQVDLGEGVEGGRFRGLEAVYDGVDHLYSGHSRGKVVVETPLGQNCSSMYWELYRVVLTWENTIMYIQ